MRRELLALLNACKQNPDDEAARGVLADWLEEHGDEDDRRRAEFIRLELASGPERGRPEFYSRRNQAWNENEAKWAPYQADLKRNERAWSEGGLVTATATVKGLMSEKGRRWAGTEEWAWVLRL